MVSKDYGQRDGWAGFVLPLTLTLGLVLLLTLNAEEMRAGAVAMTPWEGTLRWIAGLFASGAEIAAALVIGVAVLRAVGSSLPPLVRGRDARTGGPDRVRLRLGRALALGLEFTVASDILRTAVAPTRQDLLALGAIVMLRSLLNYFLEREIREGEEHEAALARSPSPDTALAEEREART